MNVSYFDRYSVRHCACNYWI